MPDSGTKSFFDPNNRWQPRGWFALALGWALVLLGVVGLFLPVLQGVLLIGVGMGLLMRESPRVRRWARAARGRFLAWRARRAEPGPKGGDGPSAGGDP